MREKTATSGIRYKINDVEFIKKRERLETLQEVFRFLMEEYMKLYKVEKPSIFSVEQPKVFDMPENKSITYDEPNQWQELKKQTKTFAQYLNLKKELEFEQEFIDFYNEVDNDNNLTTKQKQTIKIAT